MFKSSNQTNQLSFHRFTVKEGEEEEHEAEAKQTLPVVKKTKQKQNVHETVLGIIGKKSNIREESYVLFPSLCITYKLSMFLFSSCHILDGGPRRPIKEPREEKHQISSDSLESGVLQC